MALEFVLMLVHYITLIRLFWLLLLNFDVVKRKEAGWLTYYWGVILCVVLYYGFAD